MQTTTNISAYKFAPLSNLKPLREHLIQICAAGKLKGTILLSTEGINLFVAGNRSAINTLICELRQVPGLEDVEPKVSESAEQPFRRMLVKIKKEIIAFGVEGIDPARAPAPKLPPRELKQWLDEGRPLTLIDTRNDYEVQLGTFQHAMPLNIDHFRQFPEAVRQLPAEMKKQPIVMFCTGGIRCEKAGPFMQREGFEQIFQLDGGILKYFEECGGAHYDGECFVFDQRVGVDPSLHESESAQCFVCQSPLTPEEQEDPRFVEGLSCPYCYKTTEEQRAATLAERHTTLQQVVNPLPGSQPYVNERPLNVPAEYDGVALLDFLCGILSHIPREDWKQACDEGRIRKRIHPPSRSPGRRPQPTEDSPTIAASHDELVRAGQRYLHIIPGTQEPDVNVQIRILYEDEAIIVVHKPAPLPTHPSGRFSRNTLQSILCQVYFPQSPRPSHRLDANTSGVVVFARTRHFAKLVQRQFEQTGPDAVCKRYLARVHGIPSQDEFECTSPISADAGQLGSRHIDDEHGLAARTGFKVLERFPDGTSLLEAIPYTGRTNQIRVHLWHLGHPICGDATYRVGHQLGDTQTVSLDAPPLCLLAQRIEFKHPLTGERVHFETDLPPWTASDFVIDSTK
ncbi:MULTISPECIES: oxygen-dependent tRNA uridine(34) hydroxylase TrhO [unclassified Schlesneria]|uniref:oxygen-dependent tRNA uridine(34) hydroxylase TrhO n=1 Tax=unclassified Schlesneria TaxID=2762017 RepID=UPI002F142535